MDYRLTTVSEEELLRARCFSFADTHSRRNVLLASVMPRDESLQYYTIITDLTVYLAGREHPCSNFDEFFRVTRFENSANGLESARREHQIIEGEKKLPASIAVALKGMAKNSESLFIRCWEDPNIYCWKVPISEYLMADDLLDVLPNNHGEFELFDEGSSWYMRIKDDDPFIFLAAPASKQLLEMRSGVMTLPPDFTYAW